MIWRLVTPVCSLPPRTPRSVTRNTSSLLEKLRSPTVSDCSALAALVDEGTIVTAEDDPDLLARHNVDWKREYHGRSTVLLRPRTTAELSRILSYCHVERLGVVPQAGNTGLVGGSVPVADEIIVSVARMNQIHGLDRTSGILTCDAGCILSDLHNYTADRDHLVPIDLGAKGSCMIGGNVSTNAGGQYFYRFGSLKGNVLGLEVVLADGTVLDLTNTNRKDNTGYDLKQLFIGAEGSLGIISKINLSCPRLPSSRNTAFLALENFDAVRRTLRLAKVELGECLAAFEFMDRAILDLVSKSRAIPISMDGSTLYPFYVLVETQGSNGEHDSEKMATFLERAMSTLDVVDGILSQDIQQVEEMWAIREACNPAVAAEGRVYKYDISIPVSDYYEIVEEMKSRLGPARPDALVVNWGHVIDSNLHFNVTTPGMFEEDPEIVSLIEPYLFESVVRRKGSISAEHGLGQCKNEYLGTLAKSPTAVSKMRAIKQLFDPHYILSPGKYLPAK